MTISANFPNVQPSLLLDFANAKQLPPSVTFTRATTATYYDGSTTALAEQNLMVYSQSIGTSPWTVGGSSVALNTVAAPDGTTTASTLTEDTGIQGHYIQAITNGAYPSAPSDTYTVSIYAKQGSGSRSLAIALPDAGTGGYAVAVYDFATGTVTYTASSGNCTYISSSMTSVGSGWYRCVLTGIKGGTNFLYANISLSNSTTPSSFSYGTPFYTGNGTSSVYLWGCQIEQRATVTAYTATTTQAITNYIPVLLTAGGGQPRFDHNPTTSESLGLLIEQQSTNLALYSADFSNAVWSKVRSSVSSNVIIAPDGTLTGDKLVEDSTASNTHFILQNIALGGSVDSSPYAVSIYAKAGERTRLQMFDNNSVSSGVTVFDLSTGTVVSGTGKIASVGNGWYRCSIYPLKDYATNSTVWIILDNGTTTSYTGNGFSGLYIWGFQLETTSFITSYIPTTSAAATRAADVVSMSGANFSSWYSPGNGTFYAEASTASVASDVMIAEGTNSAGSFLDFSMTFATTSTQFINRFVPTSNDMRRTGVVAVNTMVKFSGSITNSSGTTIASANGVTASSTGNQGANFGADRMFIGSRGGSSLFINAPIKKFAFYPAQLTQTQQNSITG